MRFNLIAILVFVTFMTFAQEHFREPFIEVSGSAQMEVEPNEITLWIRLREFEENKTKTPLEKLDQDFLTALRSAGIDRKRLELADAGSNLSKLGKKDKDAFREKSYQLKITGAAELEKFLEKIEPVKVDQVKIIRVNHSEIEKLKLDLKVKALQAARGKAETLLKSVGTEIGKTLMVREWDNEPIQPFAQNANVYLKARDAAGITDIPEESDISFRKIQLRAQVTAQFEIK
jgi:uncharacterized protein YggE